MEGEGGMTCLSLFLYLDPQTLSVSPWCADWSLAHSGAYIRRTVCGWSRRASKAEATGICRTGPSGGCGLCQVRQVESQKPLLDHEK